MYNFKIFTHSLLLAATPSLLVYPQNNLPSFQMQKVNLEEKTEDNHIWSYDEIMNLLDELESGELEKRSTLEDLERINHFLALLSRQGILPDESEEDLSDDIEELLHADSSYEYAFSLGDHEYMIIPAIFNGDAEIVLCKGWVQKKWKKTKQYVKKHKKGIIIGAAIAIATAVVVVAIVAASSATAGAAAASAAGAAGSASSSKSDTSDKQEQKEESLPVLADILPVMTPTNESPILKSTIEEHISIFKENITEDNLLQLPNYSKSHENAYFGETVRNLTAILAHETLDGVSDLAFCIPQLFEEIKEISHRLVPESILSPNSGIEIAPRENYEKLIIAGHKKIDEVFSTDQAERYASEIKDNFVIGILPFPGDLSKIRGIIKSGQKTALLAEELGLTNYEIIHLKKTGALEKTVANTFENIISDKKMFESYKTFGKAEAFLKLFKGRDLPEIQIRELIHQAGMKTFPRPSGIPENFKIKISKKGAGMKYIHPEDTHISVRVMPGKPHSLNPSQQKPYVIQMKDGMALDKFGNKVPIEAPEAHIPIEEFIYRSN